MYSSKRDLKLYVADCADLEDGVEPPAGRADTGHFHLGASPVPRRQRHPDRRAEDDFESSSIEWVPLETVSGLIGAGHIRSGYTLGAVLYTLAQDASGSR
jgi:hypothetical protein